MTTSRFQSCRRLCRTSLVLTTVAALACTGGERGGLSEVVEPGAAKGFNLFVITLDTTRADHLGAYGYSEASTPSLDRLAEDGVRFEHAFTTAPITLPSHTTIFTGLLPPHHGVRDNAEYSLSADHVTLAETLGSAGYETAAFVSAFVLESRYGLDQGFDLYDDEAGFSDEPSLAGRIVERPAETVTEAAIDWLNSREPSRPFFAWVHYFDPHMPYQTPEPYATRFADRPYDGEIAYMDHHVGRLIQALARTAGRERTVILVVGDHGEGLGEHGEDSHAMLIYDSVMRVPLILNAPGIIERGMAIEDRVVSTADIVPTLLDLLGVEGGAPVDGISLVAGRPATDRAVYLECLSPYLHNGWAPLFGLRGVADKYILAPSPEYYDLIADPGEITNLWDRATGPAEKRSVALADDLDARLAEGPSVVEVAEAAVAVDVETMKKLRALGYVAGGAPSEATLRDPKEMMSVLRHIHRAGASMGEGNLSAALDEILLAAEKSPHDRTVLELLGAIHLMLGDPQEAEKAFREFIEIRPAADVCAMLAQVMMGDGRYDEAWAMLDRAEALDPHHGVIHLSRGKLLERRGQIDEAIAAYERAGRDDPSLTRAAANRIARLRNGDSRPRH